MSVKSILEPPTSETNHYLGPAKAIFTKTDMLSALFGGSDGEVVLNSLLRCLGFNQGNGSLVSIGSSGRSVGRIAVGVEDSRITGSVGDSLGITGSVGDSLLVSMWELLRPCSWRLLLRLH